MFDFNQKKEWVEKFDSMINTLGSETLPDVIQDRIENAKDEIESFEMVVPVIGGFSSGKSALLNAFLGEGELLPENIRPETAIATELRYGPETSLVAVKEDGTRETWDVKSIQEIDPESYAYVEYTLPNPDLKKFERLVLVDMPGMDSSIKGHNNAILRYIGRAKGVIVLTDVENGQLRASVLDQMDLFFRNEIPMSVLVSKADLKPEAASKEVQQGIQAHFKEAELDIPVGIVSATTGRIEDFCTALNAFNPDEILNKASQESFGQSQQETLAWLRQQEALVECDTKEIDGMIREIENQKREIDRELKDQKRTIEEKFSDYGAYEIVRDVENALNASADGLASALSASPDLFKQEMNAIVMPVLTRSFDSFTSETMADVTENIENRMRELHNNFDVKFKMAGEKTMDLGKSLIKSNLWKKGMVILSKNPILARLITIIPTIISPIIGVILIFLPEVLSFLKKSFGPALSDRIRNEIIPKIVSQIRPEVASKLSEIGEEAYRCLEESLKEKYEAIEQGLAQAKGRKEKVHASEDEQKQIISHMIQAIESI